MYNDERGWERWRAVRRERKTERERATEGVVVSL